MKSVHSVLAHLDYKRSVGNSSGNAFLKINIEGQHAYCFSHVGDSITHRNQIELITNDALFSLLYAWHVFDMLLSLYGPWPYSPIALAPWPYGPIFLFQEILEIDKISHFSIFFSTLSCNCQ